MRSLSERPKTLRLLSSLRLARSGGQEPVSRAFPHLTATFVLIRPPPRRSADREPA